MARKLTTLERIHVTALLWAAAITAGAVFIGWRFDGALLPWWAALAVFVVTFAIVHAAETKSAKKASIRLGDKVAS